MTYIGRGWEKLALISALYSMNPSEMTYGSLSVLQVEDVALRQCLLAVQYIVEQWSFAAD